MEGPVVTAFSDAVVAELVARYSPKQKRNPAWDRKAERQAFKDGTDYDAPWYVDRTAEEMAGDVCMATEDMGDGCPSLRVLTYAEIASVVEAVEARAGADAEHRDMCKRNGFPWCDTCGNPAVFREGSGVLHATAEQPHGVHPHEDRTDHEPSMVQWANAPGGAWPE